MKAKVRINKNQLNRFRSLARSKDKEIQAYLIGHVVNPDLTVIDRFEYTKKYHTQTSTEVRWFEEDYEKVKHKAEEEGKRIVGDIHTHLNWDSVMSPTDATAHVQDGHRICGICSVLGKRTRVRFWIMESALPCLVEYV